MKTDDYLSRLSRVAQMDFVNQYHLGLVLSIINYSKLRTGLDAKRERIVLLEYIHSPADSDVFSTQRLPGTTTPINDVLWGTLMNMLRDVIDVPNSYLYTRRKCFNNKPTDYRQLVMRVDYPEPVVASEHVFWDDMPPLVPLRN